MAKAINARGQIVGTSFSCAVGGENATLWENGSAISLNSFVPPGSDLHLTGDDMYINNRGVIAGTAIRPNGDLRAFLLIPCGEGAEGCTDAAETVTAVTQNEAGPNNSARSLQQGPTKANPWAANPMMRSLGRRSMPWYPNFGIQPPPK